MAIYYFIIESVFGTNILLNALYRNARDIAIERTRLHAEYKYFATELQSVFLFCIVLPYRIGYYIGRVAIYRVIHRVSAFVCDLNVTHVRFDDFVYNISLRYPGLKKKKINKYKIKIKNVNMEKI